jgi:hypothetical protein
MRLVIAPRLKCQAAADGNEKHAPAACQIFGRKPSDYELFCSNRSSILASKNDVFFCPGMDLQTVRAAQFVVFNLGAGPQAFLDRFAGRRQFRGRRASDQDAFNDWSLCFFWHCGCKKLHKIRLAKPINDARFVDIVGGHFQLHPVADGQANKAFAHLSGNVCENEMFVRELNAKHCARENGNDFSFQLDRFPGIHDARPGESAFK